MTEGVGALPALGDDDPTYAGWIRLALVERRYRPDPARSYRAPVEEITVLAAAIAVPLGAIIPPSAFPFKDGDVNDWWRFDPPSVVVPTWPQMGPVVGLKRATDWLGSTLVLIPPTTFSGYLRLEPTPYGRPLMWRDTQGNAAVALRTWWVRNPEALSAEPAACEGADLVVRPDLFERVSLGFGVPLRELRVVLRRPITEEED